MSGNEGPSFGGPRQKGRKLNATSCVQKRGCSPDPHVSNVALSIPRAFSPDSRVTHIRNRTDFERMSIHLPCSLG